MSQSATDCLRSVVQERGQKEREDVSTVSRSELQDLVKEGVREGIEEHERNEHWDDATDGSTEESASGGKGKFLMVVLSIAALAFLRRRSRRNKNDGTDETSA